VQALRVGGAGGVAGLIGANLQSPILQSSTGMSPEAEMKKEWKLGWILLFLTLPLYVVD
jgi:hypothetical protein